LGDELTICLVSGKFKVLHIGHLRLFNTASSLADKLIVAVDDSDISSEELDWRINLIKNIEIISEVITYSGDIKSLINKIKPNFIVKGAEFSRLPNIEEDELAKYGGKLVFSSGSYFYTDLNTRNSLKDSIYHDYNYLNRRNLNKNKIIEKINDYSRLNICVIGDLIVDEFIECKPVGMSQESPSIVVTPIKTNRFVGGAGVLAKHCEKLGSKTTFIGVVGTDEPGNWALEELKESNLELFVSTDSNRNSTVKTRYMSGRQVMFRLNHFNNEFIGPEIEQNIIKFLKNNCEKYDLLIFSDFSFGLLSPYLVSKIIEICKKHKVTMAADSQSSSQLGDLSKYIGVDLVTPTEKEARIEMKDETSGLVVLAENLRNKLACKNVILKLGADGILIHGINEIQNTKIETDQINALNINPQSISGAGDSLMAGAALSLASGANIYESAYIGSAVAALHVSKDGNLPVEKSKLVELIELI